MAKTHPKPNSVPGYMAVAMILGGVIYAKTNPIGPGEPESIAVTEVYEVGVGEIVKVDMTGNDAKAVKFGMHPPGTAFLVDSNRRILYFATPKPGTYYIDVGVANCPEVDLLKYQVIVTGDDPPEPPVVEPSPFAGLVVFVPSLDVARKIANAYDTARGTTKAELIASAKEGIADAVGDARAQWDPIFNRINRKYDLLKLAKKLKTLESYLKAFKQTAAAFREATQ